MAINEITSGIARVDGGVRDARWQHRRCVGRRDAHQVRRRRRCSRDGRGRCAGRRARGPARRQPPRNRGPTRTLRGALRPGPARDTAPRAARCTGRGARRRHGPRGRHLDAVAGPRRARCPRSDGRTGRDHRIEHHRARGRCAAPGRRRRVRPLPHRSRATAAPRPRHRHDDAADHRPRPARASWRGPTWPAHSSHWPTPTGRSCSSTWRILRAAPTVLVDGLDPVWSVDLVAGGGVLVVGAGDRLLQVDLPAAPPVQLDIPAEPLYLSSWARGRCRDERHRLRRPRVPRRTADRRPGVALEGRDVRRTDRA